MFNPCDTNWNNMLPIGQTIKNNYKAANIDSSEYISSGEARG